jgi:hypothetical membrane protein
MTTLDITPERRTGLVRSSTSRTARLAVAGAAGFVTSVVAGTVVAPPEYDTLRDTISVLAAVDNPHAWIVQAGFLSMAVGLGASAVGLWRARHLSARVAASFVAVAAVAMVAAGLNQVACNPSIAECKQFLEADPPRATVIHGRAALFVFAPLVLAGFAVARAVRLSGRRRLAVAVLGVAALDVALVFLTENAGTACSGLTQRLFALGSMGLPVLGVWVLGSPRARGERVRPARR